MELIYWMEVLTVFLGHSYFSVTNATLSLVIVENCVLFMKVNVGMFCHLLVFCRKKLNFYKSILKSVGRSLRNAKNSFDFDLVFKQFLEKYSKV